MNADEWERRLMDAANRLRQVELTYYRAVSEWEDAKMSCAIKEADLIRENKVNMRNPDTRNADLWKHAKDERKQVVVCEAKVDSMKSELHYYQSMFDALLTSARLYAARGDRRNVDNA